MITNTFCPIKKIIYDSEKLLHTIPAGSAVFELIYYFDGTPDDYRFLSINPDFEKITQLKSSEITNKTLAEILPDTGKYWTEMFYHVSENSGPVVFEHYSAEFDKYLQVTVSFSDHDCLFCSLIDITNRKQTEDNLKKQNIFLQNISDNMFDLVSLTDMEGNYKFLGASHSILDYDLDAMIGKSVLEFVHPDDLSEVSSAFRDFTAKLDNNRKIEYRYRCAAGSYLWFETVGRFIRDDSGNPVEILFSTRDITERRISEEYRDMNRKILEILNASEDLHTNMQKVLAVITAYTGFDAAGLRLQAGNDFPYYAHDGFTEDLLQTENTIVERDAFGQVISGKTDPPGQYFTSGGSFWTNDKADIPFKDTRLNPRDCCLHDGFQSIALVPVRDKKNIFGLIHLISRNKGLITLKLVENLEEAAWYIGSALMRRQGEEDREKLQAQLNQSQKMESVGRLAGGIAHDFNNMLGAILGHTELAMESMDSANPVFDDLIEIEKAARRSADLTKQLLGFARKQTAAPKVLDLNEVIDGMLNMLKRVISENIKLLWQPGTKMWHIKMDSSQIDQILANLCVNASDAINGIGSLNIRTETCVVDQSICKNRDGFYPGEYVKLSVTDDGCGMNKETRDKLFEPFFTTKKIGKGTGLGLATVYGIVKQNNGFIDVYSEPGHGSSFSIYLPRYYGTDYKKKMTASEDVKTGNETILLVEDEPAILKMTEIILGRLGYTVKAASTPGEAGILADLFGEEIHLLITDVIMPEMNGHDLAAELLLKYPDLKILFMSGYTDDIISQEGMLGPGSNYIQKPFSMKSLGEKVRSTLDKPDKLIG